MVRDLTEGRGADVALECTGFAEAILTGLDMIRRGGTYIVAGVFAEVGDITINPHHLAAKQAPRHRHVQPPADGLPGAA